MFKGITLRSCLIALFFSAFQAFGLYHVHSVSGVTEGGVLGLTLLLIIGSALSKTMKTVLKNSKED